MLLALAAALTLTACSPAGAGQASGSASEITSLLQSRRFVFVPQTVNPTGGRTRQLNGEFSLYVSPDTVRSYLPYFGRAFTAPITQGKSAMDFTTTNFSLTVQPGRKNRQTVTITPTQGTDVRELVLEVLPNGNASLLALSNNRQQINYYGYIRKP